MAKFNTIRVFSFAKFQAILMTLVGLLCGILYSFGGLLIDLLVSIDLLSSKTMSTPGLSYGTVLAFGALIGMPIIFAIIGFLTGVLEALLYNLFVKWFGGVKIDFEQKQ
jgi:hypothetical protein